MLVFCIRNWGSTDGSHAVGSNAIIKIIYMLVTPGRAREGEWSHVESIPHGNYGGACLGEIGGFTWCISSLRAPQKRNTWLEMFP